MMKMIYKKAEMTEMASIAQYIFFEKVLFIDLVYTHLI